MKEIDIQSKKNSKSNKISTQTCTILGLPARSLLECCSFGNMIWILFIISIQLTPMIQEVSLKLSVSLLFFIIFLAKVIKNSITLRNQINHDAIINSSEYAVFRDPDFEIRPSMNIVEGDMILIKNDQTIPADGLILAMSNETNEAYSQNIESGQRFELEKKKAIKETQSYITEEGMTLSDVKKHIEYIKVPQPNPFYDKVTCAIKTKSNPRVIHTTVDNFISADSVLIENDWVLILIIYTGHETKKLINYKPDNFKKHGKIDQLINIILILSSSAAIFFVLLTCFLGAFYSKYQNEDTSVLQALYSIVLFGNMNLISLQFCLVIIELISALFFNLTRPMASILDEKVIKDLAGVEFLFCDKHGILALEEIEIEGIMLDSSVYFKSEKDESVLNVSPNQSKSSQEDDKIYANFEELHGIMATPNEEQMLIGAALILCNTFTTNDSHIACNRVDSALLQLAGTFGFNLMKRDGKIAEIEINTIPRIYSIVSTSESRSNYNIIKATIKDQTSGHVYLVYKLPFTSLAEIETDESFNISDQISNPRFSTLQKIIFLYKQLTKSQVKKLTKEFNQVTQSKVNQKQRRAEVFNMYKEEMKFLCVIGFESRIKPKILKTCEEICNSGIKLCITGHENVASCIATGFKINLIDDNTNVISFEGCKTPADAVQMIDEVISEEFISKSEGAFKNTESYGNAHSTERFKGVRVNKKKMLLNELGIEQERADINQLISKELNFVVLINSKVIKHAFQSRELMQKLVILIFKCQGVFGYRLGSESKKKLIEIVKKNLVYKPVVMAMGKYQDSFKMMSEATISVKVTNDFSQDSSSAQMFLADFEDIKSIILDFGRSSYQRLQILLILFLIKTSLEGTLLFLYQSISSFSASPFINYDLLTLFDIFLSIFYLLPLIFTYNSQDCSDFLSLVSQTSIKISQKFLIYLICFFIGAAQGVAMFFFTVYGVSQVANSSGMTEDSDSTGLTCFILLNLSFYMQGFIFSTNIKKLAILFIFSTTLLLIIISIACNSNLGYFYLSHSSFINRSTIWPLIVLYPFVSFLISFIFTQFFMIFRHLIQSREEQYEVLESVFDDNAKWKVVHEHSNFEIDPKLLQFKDLYREREYIQTLYKKSRVYLQGLLILIFILALINNVFIEVGLSGFLNLGRNTIIVTVFSFVFMLASFYYVKESNFFIFELSVVVLILAFSISQTFADTSSTTFQRYPLFAGLFSLIICTGWKWSIVKFIMIFIVSIPVIIYETYVFDNKSLAVNVSYWLIIMPFLLILILIVNYTQEKNRRNEFIYIKKADIEVQRSSTILGYLLPDFVRKRVKDGARYIAEDKGTVSVIFCDIYEFDKIMDTYTPKELTYLLNDIFGRIDLICDNFGITKIETVGKTYLACAGLKDSEIGVDPTILSPGHARRAVEMALAVLKESEKIKLKDGSHLKFKIGVNSGPVIAGVVGFHKPQFSLVGDTVNTSSRMASTLAESHAVQISMSTFDLLASTKGLNFSDCIREVKGKGMMNTKLVSTHDLKQIDTGSDDLSSGLTNKKLSFLSYVSSPTLPLNHNRNNEIAQAQIRPHRASLLMNLGVQNAKELHKKQTTQKVNNIFSLLCKESGAEKDFRLNYIHDIKITQRIGLILAIACNFCLIIAELIYVIQNLKQGKLIRLIIVIVWEVFMILALVLSKKHSENKRFAFFLSFIYTANFLALFISERFYPKSQMIDYMYYFYDFVMLNFYSGNLFARNIYFNLVFVSLWLTDIFTQTLILPHISYIFTIIFIVLFTVFTDEKRMRENTVLKNAAEKEITKTQQLLTQMMPPTALSNLEKGYEVMDRLNQVTIMFADIVGFTAWSSTRTPFEVVSMLSELFTRFDKMCVENSVYKVHTIGDCYVAMGYVNDKNRNPAKEAVNMIRFASTLIELIRETNETCQINLGMRIGIHTGEVTGGIIGTKIVRYDIYGAHVMIANKMESNGQSGKIAVSEATKEIIESYDCDLFTFEEGKDVKVSSDGTKVKMFFYNEDRME